MANLGSKTLEDIADDFKMATDYVKETEKEGFTREEVLTILADVAKEIARDVTPFRPGFDRNGFLAACGVEVSR